MFVRRERCADITSALGPGELFALRQQSFDDANMLALSETVYRREIETQSSNTPA
jgi:hypothetical protein